MKSRKRIMMIIPNLDFGGAQKSFSNLNQELAKHYTIYVVVFNTSRGIEVPLNGEIIDLQIPAGTNYLTKGLLFIKRILKIKSLKKELNITTSISFLEGANYVNILSKVSEKTLLSIRGSKLHDENIIGALGSFRKRFLIPWLYNKADVIIAVNERIRNEIKNHFNISVKTEVIPNFYRLAKLDQLANEKPRQACQRSLSENSFKIFSVGRLAPEKGYQHLIKVVGMLKSEYSVKLYLVGKGDYKQELIKTCSDNGLNYIENLDHVDSINMDVCFLGYDSNPLKYAKYADLFVLPSSAEGFPNALLEMMSQRVPVMGTECDGIKEILISKDKKFGTLLPLFNKKSAYEKWAFAIKDLIETPQLREELGILAKERSKMFDRNLTINQWLELL